jgi:hypothetical protein
MKTLNIKAHDTVHTRVRQKVTAAVTLRELPSFQSKCLMRCFGHITAFNSVGAEPSRLSDIFWLSEGKEKKAVG